MDNRKILLTILGIALLIRTLVLLIYPQIPELKRVVEGGDAIGYTQLAQNLLHTHSFRFEGGSPTAYRMPGYPVFLALTYIILPTNFLAQILQIIADLLTTLVVFQLCRSITPNEKTALLAAAFIALNPLLWVASISLLPETLTIFLVCVACLLLGNSPDNIRGISMAFVVLGIGIYLKPTIAAVAVGLLIVCIVRQILRQNQRAVIMTFVYPILILTILMVPWATRNLLVMRAFIPLTTSNGSNLYGGNNPQADGGYVSNEPYVIPNMSEVDSDRIFTNKAIDWIKANPTDFVELLPKKALRFLWPLAFGTAGYFSVPTVIFGIVFVVTILFYLLITVGILRTLFAKLYWKLIVLTTVPTILLLLTLITFGSARFSLPGFPSFAVLASLGLEGLGQLTKNLGNEISG